MLRIVAASALIGVCLGASVLLEPHAPSVFGHAAHHRQKQAAMAKPGRDSCRWANDRECDEPDIGTGACPMGTDYSDCRHLRAGEDDSCPYAHDGECDEPNFGTGACTQGSDHSDCGDIAWLRNETDSCPTAFNGVCEEPGRGNGACPAHTDRADCLGRNRPMNISDHFFGHDDRVRVPADQAPWKYIGELTLDSNESCTATLIARDVIVTAAHCIVSDDGVNAGAEFSDASDQHSARVSAYFVDRRFDIRRFETGNSQDGMDWALLRLDRPIGDQVGFAGVQNLTARGARAATHATLMQAGYAWDTGDTLAGVLSCHMVAIHADNTFEHQCDTTRGDSGSAFFVRNSAGAFEVVGVDSNFRFTGRGPEINIGVSAAAFAPYIADFVAGRSGTPVSVKPKN
jgi:protease YdgD